MHRANELTRLSSKLTVDRMILRRWVKSNKLMTNLTLTLFAHFLMGNKSKFNQSTCGTKLSLFQVSTMVSNSLLRLQIPP